MLDSYLGKAGEVLSGFYGSVRKFLSGRNEREYIEAEVRRQFEPLVEGARRARELTGEDLSTLVY